MMTEKEKQNSQSQSAARSQSAAQSQPIQAKIGNQSALGHLSPEGNFSGILQRKQTALQQRYGRANAVLRELHNLHNNHSIESRTPDQETSYRQEATTLQQIDTLINQPQNDANIARIEQLIEQMQTSLQMQMQRAAQNRISAASYVNDLNRLTYGHHVGGVGRHESGGNHIEHYTISQVFDRRQLTDRRPIPVTGHNGGDSRLARGQIEEALNITLGD